MIPIAASAAQTSSGRPSAVKAGLGARGGGIGREKASACEFPSSAASSVVDVDDDATLVGDGAAALDRPRDGAESWPRLSTKRPRTEGSDRLRSRGEGCDWLGVGGIRRDGDADKAAAEALVVARCCCCSCPAAALIWIVAVVLFAEEDEDGEWSSSSEVRRRRRMQQLSSFD